MSNEKQTPSVVLGERYAQAVAYASQLHATQVRKETSIPYVSHLIGVSSLVLEAGGDEDMAIAALLHDGPEDQGGQATLDEIRALFGDRVARIVGGCTDSLAENPEEKDDWHKRKTDYIAHLQSADDDSLTVSLADKLHNARAIVSDLLITGATMWSRFRAGPDDILWYYGQVLQVGQQRGGNAFLVTNLGESVKEMERLRG
jgi:(p)ppGpp synthase/HD superfamily hydrolase